MKYGMERIINIALFSFFGISLLYLILFYNTPNPSVIILLAFFAMQFFAIGFLFGNLRAMAMQPIGHIAGIGAAITGFLSTIMAVPISIYIGKFVDQRALPLFIGFLICGFLSILIVIYLRLDNKRQREKVISKLT